MMETEYMKIHLLAGILWLYGLPVFSQGQAVIQPIDTSNITTVFENGESAYACFRIPAIVRSPQGLLLAFAEGRKLSCSDFGDVDIVLKTSADEGRSWSPLRVIANNGNLQSSNAAPVFDLLDPAFPQGRLFLFYNTGTVSENECRQGKGIREVWYTVSTDQGQSWAAPVNITAQVSKPHMPSVHPAYQDPADWRTYANTPGHALQLASGRIFVAANHSAGPAQDAFRDYRAHGYFSDDHGVTFKLSPDIHYPGSNESIAAALPGGGLLMSIRNQSGDTPCRLLALSRSGGESWDSLWVASGLPDPVCQGSLLDVSMKDGQRVLLHSNPADSQKRCCLTLKISYDQGYHWLSLQEIYSGSAAYSDLVQITPDKVGVLFELDQYTRIGFVGLPFVH